MERKASPAASSAFSPSDMVGPSPVTSNGTDTTEIEDEENGDDEEPQLPDMPQTPSEATQSPATVCSIFARPKYLLTRAATAKA